MTLACALMGQDEEKVLQIKWETPKNESPCQGLSFSQTLTGT